MKHIKYLSYIMVIMLIVAALALSCAPKPAAPEVPIKIGALLPFTGFNAINAEELKGGIELKLDEVGWEVAGRKIELILEDNATDPVVSVDKARKMVEADKVDVVLGPLLSMFAVADYLTESRTPNIYFMHNGKGILEFGGGNTFLHFGTLEGLGYPLGLYAYDELGYRTATVIHDDFVAGEDFAGGTMKGFEARGGTIVQRQRSPLGNMDYSAYITAMNDADAVFFWFTPMSMLPFLTQYYDYGLKMPLVLPCCNVASEPALAEIGDITLGMVGTSMYTPLIDTDINKRFVDAFVKKVGTHPRTEGASSYIATTMFLEAVKIAGGDTSHEAIIDALHKVKVDTPAGTFSYTSEGLGIGDLFIQKVIKIGDRYAWEPIYKFSQIVLDVPE